MQVKLVQGNAWRCDGCFFFDGVTCINKEPHCTDKTIYKLIEEGHGGSTEEYNNVSKPKHYMLFPEKNIEVRHLMQVLADRLESNGYSGMFISDYIQMQQYLLRFDEKNRKEDLEKAQWYLGKLIESKDFDA